LCKLACDEERAAGHGEGGAETARSS